MWLFSALRKSSRAYQRRLLAAKNRFRRLVVEHLEDRRVLAMATDDSYSLFTNGSIGGNVLDNDAYTDGDQYTCTDWELSEDDQWVCNNWVYDHTEYASFTLDSEPLHGSLSWYGGGFTYTPDANFVGEDSFSYSVEDSTSSSSATATFDVQAIDIDAQDDFFSTVVNTPVSGNVLANDSDTAGIALSASGDDPNVQLASDGTFNFTPPQGFVGTYTFTYYACAGNTSAPAILSISVGNPPAANDDAYTTQKNVPLVIDAPGVLGNDTDAGGDQLTASFGSPSHGTISGNSDGSFTYTPAADFEGIDSFSYWASDSLLSSPATITITVGNVPVAIDDSYSTDESTPLVIVADNGVLANDTDADGEQLTALFNSPSYGSISGNPDGSFTYTPVPNFRGTDSFSYWASDGYVSSQATVTILVDAPPSVTDDSYSTDEDTPLVIDDASGVLANDTDADGEPLTASFLQPSHGSISGNPDGSFTYTPAPNFNGTDSFTYTASNEVGTVTGAVTITVNPVDDPPVTTDDSNSTDEDTPLVIEAPNGVLANDTGGDLTASFSDPLHGTISGNPDGSFTYTPAANFNGTDSFLYTATNELGSATGTVTITVNSVNDPPVAVSDQYLTTLGVPITASAGHGVLNNDSDVDGDSLSASPLSGPSHGALILNTNGSFTYTPDDGFHGTDSFVYLVSDGIASSNGTVSITVDSAPATTNDSYSTDEDTPLVIATAAGVLTNDTDADGDSLTASFTQPSHGSLTTNSDGSFIYTPQSHFHGTDSFTYSACDGTASTAGTVTVRVNAPPSASTSSFTTDEDIAISVPLSASDPDADTLTYSIIAVPSHGSLSGTTPNLIYSPAQGYAGTDSFTFQANDGRLDSNTATVSLTVNSSLVLSNGSASTLHDNAVTIDLPISGGSGSLTFRVVSPPAHGTITSVSPTLIYTPADGYVGGDTLTVSAADAYMTSNVVVINLSVTDQPPVANDDNGSVYTVGENQILTVSSKDGVLANDTDPDFGDKDILKATLVTGPSHGKLSFDKSGFFVYTPGANYSGTDSFTYFARDKVLSSNTATATITVTAFAPILETSNVDANAQISPSVAKTITLLGAIVNGAASDGPSKGTWLPLPLNSGLPTATGTMLLLPNGNVMAEGYGPTDKWYQLAPAPNGSYIDGTWSALSSMSHAREYFGSNVLPDGRVLIVGGEYDGTKDDLDPSKNKPVDLNTGEIYDPLEEGKTVNGIPVDPWSAIKVFPQDYFGDASTVLLPNGQVLAAYIGGTGTYLFTPPPRNSTGTGTWTATGDKLQYSSSSEETWIPLPDGSVLTYDTHRVETTVTDGGSSQRYLPSLGRWINADRPRDGQGRPTANLTSDCTAHDNNFHEIGPALRIADGTGRILFIGAAPDLSDTVNPCNSVAFKSGAHTALYTPPAANDPTGAGSWTAGPDLPPGYGADDAPAAELPNGHIIFIADIPPFAQYTPNGAPHSVLFDFDPAGNNGNGSITQLSNLNLPADDPRYLPAELETDLATSAGAFDTRMLVLPTGQVLLSLGTLGKTWVFTPPAPISQSIRPTISSVVSSGASSFTLAGTQLTGVSEGAAYGDDAEMSSNYPIVRLIDEFGNTFYALTHDWTPGVATGTATQVTTEFDLPPGVDVSDQAGHTYSLVVIANGISSKPIDFKKSLAITYSVDPNTTPSHGSLTGVGPNRTYTPTSSGTDTFSFTATSATETGSTTSTATVTIDVDAPPTANSDTYHSRMGYTLIKSPDNGVLSNDVDTDSLRASLTSVLVEPPQHGGLALDSSGAFVYVPNIDFAGGSDSFTYKASDGRFTSSSVTVTIIFDPRTLPIAVDDDYTIAENDFLYLNEFDYPHSDNERFYDTTRGTEPQLSAFGFMLNDDLNASPDGIRITAQPQNPAGFYIDPPSLGPYSATNPQFDGLLWSDPIRMTYIPSTNWTGTDSFRYRELQYVGNSTHDVSNEATVRIHVVPKPTVNNDVYIVAKGTTLSIATNGPIGKGVLANDVDTGLSGPLHISGGSSTITTANGSVVLDKTGAFSYTPNPSFGGSTESVTYGADNSLGEWRDSLPESNQPGYLLKLPDGETVEDIGPAANHQSDNTATVTFYVASAAATNDTYSTNEDTLLATAAPGVRSNDFGGSAINYTIAIVSSPSHAAAFSLNADGSFSYTPLPDYNGPDSFTYSASDGVNIINVATVTINVTSVNDAPVLSGPSNLPAIDEDSLTNPGTLVSSLISSTVTDADAADNKGIAVITADNSSGTWQYSTNGGSTWVAFNNPSDNAARLLAADQNTLVRFVPSHNFNGIVSSLVFRAWDQTTGSPGGTYNINLVGTGGATAFSSATASASITVNPVNDAPTLTSSDILYPINEDPIVNDGTLVSLLIASRTSDVDGPDTGIAVTAVDNANGTWQYSTDSGSTWIQFVAPSENSARLLAADNNTLVRFVPHTNFNGIVAGLTFRAWDQSSGVPGAIANVSTNGGVTAFSTNTATACISITSVNDRPTFSLIAGPNQTANDDQEFVPIKIMDSMSAGAPDEDDKNGPHGQTLSFEILTTDPNDPSYHFHPELFRVPPAIDANGILTFTPEPNVHSQTDVRVIVHDGGGTDNGGIDTSAAQTFTITITKHHHFHNEKLPLDVNDDGVITQADAQAVIDYINQHGSGSINTTNNFGPPYVDTDTAYLDYVYSYDDLIIINYLNSTPGNRIGGIVFHDSNHDVTQQSGDAGIPDVYIFLDGTDHNSKPVHLGMKTDSNGQFLFPIHPSDNYYNLVGGHFTIKLKNRDPNHPEIFSSDLAGQEGSLVSPVDHPGEIQIIGNAMDNFGFTIQALPSGQIGSIVAFGVWN